MTRENSDAGRELGAFSSPLAIRSQWATSSFFLLSLSFVKIRFRVCYRTVDGSFFTCLNDLIPTKRDLIVLISYISTNAAS